MDGIELGRAGEHLERVGDRTFAPAYRRVVAARAAAAGHLG
ncbi:MAG TPA: hypothetical protein VFH30_02795 [Acidimicrobiales bacterium]|nr:hypothetical protein [Acidimicrobiales bacterium]